MGETSDQIEIEIDRKRAELGSDLHELEQRVRSTTSWRLQFEKRPLTMIGLAFGGGVLLSRMTNGSRSRDILDRDIPDRDIPDRNIADRNIPDRNVNDRNINEQPRRKMNTGFRSTSSATNYQMNKASNMIDNIGGALIGLLAGKVRGLMRDAIPGFDEQYRRVEQHKSAQTPNTDPA